MLTAMKSIQILRKTLPFVLCGLIGYTLSGPFHAQTAPNRIGFINADEALKAHRLNSKIEEIRTNLRKEVDPLTKQADDLKAKGDKLSAADKDTLNQTLQLIEGIRKKYSDQVAPLIDKINADVNLVIKDTAEKQGFSILMDRAVAASSGLVVYADEQNLDVTQTIVNAVQNQK